MPDESYWTEPWRRRLSRRRIIALSLSGTGSLATAAMVACGGSKRTGQSSTPGSGTAASGDTPRPGGNLSVFVQTNYPLDPQKVSALAQQIPGGAMSRVFKYKTGLDPKVITNHDLEPDLGISAESPDAVTWTVKLRPDARFQNIPPVSAPCRRG